MKLVRVALAATILGTMLVAVQSAPAAEAITGADFNAGYLIDDSKFYDNDAMTQTEIQNFLNAKIGTCLNSNCLNVYRMNTPSIAAETYCKSYSGAANETAAGIIFKVQAACNISAKVILVTLQKEQGLVTRTSPSDGILRKAMGMGCPDTSVCDSQYYGFFNQVYSASKQFNRYGNGGFTTRFQPGQVTNIQWHPNAACGSSPVTVKNRATMALYYYTPYQPNAAALANFGGTGDGCSSYGNRNFWVYYNSFFGSPNGDPMGKLQSVTGANNTVTVTGWAVDPDVASSPVTVRVYGAGWSQYVTANTPSADANAAFSGAGANHGFAVQLLTSVGQQNVCVDVANQGQGSHIALGCIAVTVPSSIAVARTAGADRYDTAAAISRTHYAPGVPVVYIASGENFPDALSIVPAAAAAGSPVLLVNGATIPQVVATEIARLKPQKVVVVGGAQAVSDSAATALQSISGVPVTRLGGIDRWDTSLKIGEVLGAARSGTAYVVTGNNFPDALSAASAAGSQDSPVLLLDGRAKGIPANFADALKKWGVNRLVLVGGAEAISASLQQQLTAIQGITTVERIQGPDRFATSVAINVATYGAATQGFLANAYTFPDGLTGGALAGRESAPLYLAQPQCVSREVLAQMQKSGTTTATLFGGPVALGAPVATLTPCY
jgi:putative cell wall-binding protein